MKNRNFRRNLSAFFILSSFLCVSAPAFATQLQKAEVREAVTGDTIRLKTGKDIKLIGVESPPLESSMALVREYGDNAKNYTQSLTAGKTVTLEWGPKLHDEQKRLLAYIFLEDGTFVNQEVLAHGHGKNIQPPPNQKYAPIFRRAELNARRDRLGVWKEEPINPNIKSEYIGEKNTKIFYFPTSPELDRIPAAQLVTFRSRVEASAAGYRPCSTCKEDHKTTSWY